MRKVYIVHRVATRTNPGACAGHKIKMVEKVFDIEEKAISYIRKKIMLWYYTLERRGYDLEPVIDETLWSRPGKSAYFKGRDGETRIYGDMYYKVMDVE